ncbi:hypothetical protein AXF42_Ash005268 [Apostasia shenzhenica]|uniref:Myb/SANT-like domain-containing protein n=1 Tax=Apostasia shenzhenica TaxID=1088818 RepID=A0A2I0B6E7_9ASPA|nr:hypothetical protein AXF42_Ash005268 [Apostasia shenzhenica]
MQDFHVKGCVQYGKPVARAWPEIYIQWLKFAEEPTTEIQLRTLWKNTKTRYRKFKELKEKSGWGWIEETGTPVGTDELWDELITNNPDWSKFKDKSFSVYNIVDPILDGTHAKGDYFRSSRLSQPELPSTCSQVLEDIEDDEVNDKEGGATHEAFTFTDLEPFLNYVLNSTMTLGSAEGPIQDELHGSHTVPVTSNASKRRLEIGSTTIKKRRKRIN